MPPENNRDGSFCGLFRGTRAAWWGVAHSSLEGLDAPRPPGFNSGFLVSKPVSFGTSPARPEIGAFGVPEVGPIIKARGWSARRLRCRLRRPKTLSQDQASSWPPLGSFVSAEPLGWFAKPGFRHPRSGRRSGQRRLSAVVMDHALTWGPHGRPRPRLGCSCPAGATTARHGTIARPLAKARGSVRSHDEVPFGPRMVAC